MNALIPYLVSVFLLLLIGLGCLMMKRDMIRMLIGLEILLSLIHI